MSYPIDKKDEIIKKSHERSLKYGIEKERIVSKKILIGNEVTENIKQNKELIMIAAPFTKILYDFLKGSGFLIILTDRNGCILNIIGDEGILKASKEMGMIIGAYMDEKSIGTNAMGTAISEDMPIQISAKEHFITAYHKWTCSAAPIHNCNGDIIGTLNLTGDSSLVHPHTLGLVVAAVKSIEEQIENNAAKDKLTETYLYMNTIVNSISSGIIAVDKYGIIRNMNKASSGIFQLKEEDIIGTSIEKFFNNWKDIYLHIQQGNNYHDEEMSIKRNGTRERYTLSAYGIKGEKEEIIGMVLTIKEIQRVLDLVNKFTGFRARYTFDDIIGESEELLKVMEHAKNIASSPSTVLIQGESGTGKEVLAQAIHNYSDRRGGSFVAINCGAIPKNLIESELFGYEEGAFTGAKRGGQVGKFELASGGTLFLDEIGEMPLDMQVNLLRVLQEGCVTRVGGNKYISVDVRIIAATNKDLKKEIEKGTFRQDLYYRLSVIPITLPPLRERNGDIELLIKHFLSLKADKLKKPIPNISNDIYKKMVTYNWKGNIRELENFIENIVNLNGSTTFHIENSKENVEYEIKEVAICSDEEQYLCSLEFLEKKAIIACLNKFDKNMTKTAKTLGISRNTLYLKMKKYDI